MRTITLVVAITLAIAGAALADHTEPATAKKVSASLVSAYRECSDPNTATQSNGDSACTPPSPAAFFGCTFSPSGSGKFTAVLTGSPTDGNQDIKFAAVAKRLNANCEGDSLCIWLSLRATNDDCPEGSCTIVDIERFAFDLGTCCTVTKGACKIKTTLNTAFPGLLPSNKNTGIEIRGCGLSPVFPLSTGPAVTCGLLLK
ncbi:MAG: hypothetical protein E6G45_13330 [Actinobacteria bacterium]|nr:MAG: hypothetical protein E6G45_13330 [Actinomycetota bacterium]